MLKNTADFDPDLSLLDVIGLRQDAIKPADELPVHTHQKGQLILALRGFITCEISDAIWIAPPQSAIWIPAGFPHSNKVSGDASLCLLFIAPHVAHLPTRSCTLSISPLLRELIKHFSQLPQSYETGAPTDLLVKVLLHELTQMPTDQLEFPISKNSKLRKIAESLMASPNDRSTVAQWGSRYAMSERTLTRLIKKETGMSFGRWRTQLHIIIAIQRLSSHHTVQQVSEELGYESVSAFITMFKKKLGESPKRYVSQRD
ncbi:AraC family transcriptional regulator [Shewanella canadensis]|uniref:AraC family transcriptional regulator n=1 Tax=Shewanella canadensis TaxID=271096 RepID=A0A431WS82_9GAMM|nr:helix-turn-helix transcriptional regulator [Shewanella canadensis]RTR38044.1 AraC family transcriptional regulator [Shewanella canadensis]